MFVFIVVVSVVIRVKGGRVGAVGERQWVREPKRELSDY